MNATQNLGKGWHGNTPGHKAAANKKKLSGIARRPMAKALALTSSIDLFPAADNKYRRADKPTPITKKDITQYQYDFDLSDEETKKLERGLTAKNGDTIYVNDLGESIVASGGQYEATLVIEEDSSVRWYINPDENDVGIRSINVNMRQ